jgi:ribosomal protein S18 acetylase RimI-like enzyme
MSTKHWKIEQTRHSHQDLMIGLLTAANRKHQHLVWHDPLDNLEREPFILASEKGLPIACLGCPPNPPGVSWIRVFAVASGYSTEIAWRSLWATAKEKLETEYIWTVASLAMEEWFADLLTRSGFEKTNEVIFYLRDDLPITPISRGKLDIRKLHKSDSAAVQALDARAFSGIWTYSLETMSLAIKLGGWSSGLFTEDQLLGYQITTFSPFGAHLARIAIEPEMQNLGYGKLLVIDAIQNARQRGYGKLSVNTQADNKRSQHLYQSLDFKPADQIYPVYQLDFPQ